MLSYNKSQLYTFLVIGKIDLSVEYAIFFCTVHVADRSILLIPATLEGTPSIRPGLYTWIHYCSRDNTSVIMPVSLSLSVCVSAVKWETETGTETSFYWLPERERHTACTHTIYPMQGRSKLPNIGRAKKKTRWIPSSQTCISLQNFINVSQWLFLQQRKVFWSKQEGFYPENCVFIFTSCFQQTRT